MAKTLQLLFHDQSGKQVTLNLPDPVDNLTLAQAQPVMQDIVTKGIFASKNGDLVQIIGAKIRVNETAPLE
ncbi:MAG: DUF2922 domain-containing protein [Sporomusaceae bacterium]|nr:DUF2922 domain-containing protein [Sporomusaceae bacterium]